MRGARVGLPIADRWFERKRVDDAITLLWEPHVDPLLRCNIWHVRGRDRDALIDSGLGIASLREAAADLLQREVVAIATHIHYDHVGGLHEFANRVMHRIEAPKLADYRESCGLRAQDMGVIAEGLRRAGYEVPELMLSAAPEGFDPARYRVTSAAVTRAVDEGDLIDLGDRHFEVLHLPGHSPGSIGLFEAATGTLFSGDALYDGALLDELPESDIEAYVGTMKRLLALPVRVVHAGHDASFGRERLRELARAYLDRRDCYAPRA
jgi:glyoxylase-like metal-dependent hydrolase (beta-lactamase superfamily II)